MRYGELDQRLFGLGMQRGALFSLLDAAWREGRSVHCGTDIVDIDPEGGSLTGADGRAYDGYDLIVVADGSASRLRSKVGRPVLDQSYPWGAQWCLVEQGDWAVSNELRQRYVAARRMAGMLPVGTRPGDPVPRMSFFWSMHGDRLRDDAATGDWRHELEGLWPEAAQRLATTDIPRGLLPARYRDVVHKQWSRGCAVLLGDAAHAMSPQLGQGVNMALLDARALRDALRETSNIGEALGAYQAARKHHLRAYHFWSHWLTPLFQSEYDFAAKLRDFAFHPLSRFPGGRGQMLRILSGTRRGWLRTFPLPSAFMDVLSAFQTRSADAIMSASYNVVPEHANE
jgi:2-polyprenyl-6-methoxyphenol hydroxylase-like FAD-dependent oxidoreductase